MKNIPSNTPTHEANGPTTNVIPNETTKTSKGLGHYKAAINVNLQETYGQRLARNRADKSMQREIRTNEPRKVLKR
jgi:hypothetical protein